MKKTDEDIIEIVRPVSVGDAQVSIAAKHLHEICDQLGIARKNLEVMAKTAFEYGRLMEKNHD